MKLSKKGRVYYCVRDSVWATAVYIRKRISHNAPIQALCMKADAVLSFFVACKK